MSQDPIKEWPNLPWGPLGDALFSYGLVILLLLAEIFFFNHIF